MPHMTRFGPCLLVTTAPVEVGHGVYNHPILVSMQLDHLPSFHWQGKLMLALEAGADTFADTYLCVQWHAREPPVDRGRSKKASPCSIIRVRRLPRAILDSRQYGPTPASHSSRAGTSDTGAIEQP